MLKKLMNFGKGGKSGFSIAGAFTSAFRDLMGGMKFANKLLFGSQKKKSNNKSVNNNSKSNNPFENKTVDKNKKGSGSFNNNLNKNNLNLNKKDYFKNH